MDCSKTIVEGKLMFCSNCGSKIPEDSAFCPNCGHKVGAKVDDTVEKKEPVKKTAVVSKTVQKSNEKKVGSIFNRKRLITLGILVVIVIVGFFGYRLAYLPNVVQTAIDKTEFSNSYKVEANVITKKIVMKADKAQVYNLVTAASDNGFSTHPIGAEEQMAMLEKELPGKWKIQLIQTSFANSPKVLWEYSGDQESVRYQNSNEFKNSKRAYLAAEEKKQADDDATSSAISGAVVGGLIGAAMGHY